MKTKSRTNRRKRRYTWWIVILSLYLLLDVGMKIEGTDWHTKKYEVVGLTHGALNVVDMRTGESIQIVDDVIINDALNGEIQAGDIIVFE